jgi:hypothetical protein
VGGWRVGIALVDVETPAISMLVDLIHAPTHLFLRKDGQPQRGQKLLRDGALAELMGEAQPCAHTVR